MVAFVVTIASASPGQNGVLYPSAKPDDRHGYVGTGVGVLYDPFGFNKEGPEPPERDIHHVELVELGLHPLESLSVSAMIPVSGTDAMPAVGTVTWTLAPESPVHTGIAGTVAGYEGTLYASVGLLVGNPTARVGWDLTAFPLQLTYTTDYGWTELQENTLSRRLGLRGSPYAFAAGLSIGVTKHARMRFGFPDGLTVSIRTRQVYVDFGGFSFFHLAGVGYLKTGVRF